MIVADASFWTSALYDRDRFFQPSYDLLTSWMVEQQIVLAPTILLPEVAGAISRRANDEQPGLIAVRALVELPLLRFHDLDPGLAERAFQIAARFRIRGADAVYVALASLHGVPLVTWDSEQLERAAPLVRTIRPSSSPSSTVPTDR